MAAIGTALWAHTMHYSPTNPSWFPRDRFVLSNGHCCLFQYMFLHLTDYGTMTFDQLKSYHSVLPDSLCPGHPEIEIDGIEVTTGPLGQGIANAVGLAMASEHLGATYNRPGFEVVKNMTYCTVGDACLQEGVGLEAISLAGHWKLKRLVVLYDNNQITCDGSVDVVNSGEDTNAKMRACGWDVIDIYDGNNDVLRIVAALKWAKEKNEDKPTFINCRTVIGVGSQAEGTGAAHGAAFGPEDVKQIKTKFGMDPEQHFVLPEDVKDFFARKTPEGKELEGAYNDLLERYESAYPDLAAEFKLRREGKLTGNFQDFIPCIDNWTTQEFPGRKSAGLILNPIAEHINNFMVGTADLSPSVNMLWPGAKAFQHPKWWDEVQYEQAYGKLPSPSDDEDGDPLEETDRSNDLDRKAMRHTKPDHGSTTVNTDYSGRYIHWGIREHAMTSISNGLSAFNSGTIIPITSSFFMFYIYAAPGVRMGALQGFQQIHIATHDSIGTGEDGPTHQPIELAALYRSMPNLLYIRPSDTEETVGAITLALNHKNSSSMISVSRQPQPQYHVSAFTTTSTGITLHPAITNREGVQKGGYEIAPLPDLSSTPKVTLLTAGAETRFAVAAREYLAGLTEIPVAVRIVSMPSFTSFDVQSKQYRAQTLQKRQSLGVAVEAYALRGWERFADAGFGVGGYEPSQSETHGAGTENDAHGGAHGTKWPGVNGFGISLPGKQAYERFGFERSGKVIGERVRNLVSDVLELGKGDWDKGLAEWRIGEGWRELNVGL